MKKSAIAIILVLTVLLARPHAVLAQATPAPIRGSWEGLKAVPPGDELSVSLRNGQTLKGRLSGVSDTSLTLAQRKKSTDVSRGDVLKVHRVISKSAKRATLIGLGVGAGVGMASSVAAAKSGPGGRCPPKPAFGEKALPKIELWSKRAPTVAVTRLPKFILSWAKKAAVST